MVLVNAPDFTKSRPKVSVSRNIIKIASYNIKLNKTIKVTKKANTRPRALEEISFELPYYWNLSRDSWTLERPDYFD